MSEFRPFLQIVHISDLHVGDPTSPQAASIRRWIRKLRRTLPADLVVAFEDGVAPHDPLGVRLFREFLREITVNDQTWSECKTWLVDTGDLTSLGDQKSLNLGRKYLDEFASLGLELASTHGNHDAWPGVPPLFVSKSEVAAQATRLASTAYAVGKARLALHTPIPHGGGSVQIFFADSVRRDRWHNLRALGQVPEAQLGQLQALVDQNHAAAKQNFRIVAVHHPVHFPPPRPAFQMSMSNDKQFAAALAEPSPRGAYPLAHLVLSGHTHFLYPTHGQLPPQPEQCRHPYLEDDQCQFVVGTLMQLDRHDKRSGWPHQCEVLRLYHSDEPSVLLLERTLVARRSGKDYRGTGIGPYQFVTLADGRIGEEITFSLR